MYLHASFLKNNYFYKELIFIKIRSKFDRELNFGNSVFKGFLKLISNPFNYVIIRGNPN